MLIHKFQISCTCFPTITTMKQAAFNVLLQIIDATYSGEDTTNARSMMKRKYQFLPEGFYSHPPG